MARAIRNDKDVELIAEYVAGLTPTHPASTVDGDTKRGKTLFATCVACHGVKGEGNPALKAPKLTNVDDWYLLKQIRNFRSGVRGSSPKDLNGALMRPLALTLPDDQAARDVVAFIQTLGK